MGMIFSNDYYKGKFFPKHPYKCVNLNGALGKVSVITYRSSWELKLMRFCDKYATILEWGSEVLKLPYISEVDGKQHMYITDFYMKCRDVHGNIDKYIIEVKPESQMAKLNEHNELIYPDPPKTRSQKALLRWQEKCNVIRTNNSKWKAARRWCAANGYIFKVLTERQILNMCK